MATIQQIEANRANAQQSSGPRSAEGKAVSRFNAVKTGIDAKSQTIPGEDPAELDTLAAEYHERWQPATPEERLLVDTLIHCEWLLRRFRKSEAQLWQFHIQEQWTPRKECPVGQAFNRGCTDFTRLQRRMDSTGRDYHRALKELQRLESERLKAVPPPDPVPAAGPQPIPIQHPTAELGSFHNFPSEDPSAPVAPPSPAPIPPAGPPAEPRQPQAGV